MADLMLEVSDAQEPHTRRGKVPLTAGLATELAQTNDFPATEHVIAALREGAILFAGGRRYQRADLMKNRAMQRKLDAGEAFDVRRVGEEIDPGVFRLVDFILDVDYCDAQNEAWIVSIGEQLRSGEIHAATDNRFYHNPDYKCVWLR
jgi:hypothetical protein